MCSLGGQNVLFLQKVWGGGGEGGRENVQNAQYIIPLSNCEAYRMINRRKHCIFWGLYSAHTLHPLKQLNDSGVISG